MYAIKRTLYDNRYMAIALGLYILIFIIGIIFSPWNNVSLESLQLESEETKRIGFGLAQIKFLLFGIYDLMIILENVTKEYNGFVVFIPFFVTCALFTFSHMLIEKISHYFNEENKIKKIITEYCFDNILAYIVCFVIYKFFAPSLNLVQSGMSNGLLKIVIWVLFTLFFIIPSIPKIGELLAYMISVYLILLLLDKINTSVDNHILAQILIYLAAIALLFILIVVTKILLRILVDLAKNLFKGTIEFIIGSIILIILFVVGCIILIFVLQHII